MKASAPMIDRILNRARKLTARFAKDASGATAIFFSFGTVVVMGSIAFGVDAANWYQTDRRLQTGADLSAMAAASDQTLQSAFEYAGQDISTIVRHELDRNEVNVGRLTSMTVNSPPSSGAFSGDNAAVEVVLTQDVEIFFAGMFVNATPQAEARAVARTMASGNYCILTLHPTQRGAVTFTGSSTAFLGCGIASNSNAADSVTASGSSTVETTIVTAVGGIADSGNILTPVTFQEYANPTVDPYEDLTVPAAAPCDYNNVSASGTTTLDPGVYCGSLRMNGDVTLNPGTYVIDGGDWIVNSGARVWGEDVTFIFADSSDPTQTGRPRFNGSATIDLSASTSGDYAGILFLQDPRADSTVGSNSDTWMVNGNSSSSFKGVFYVPSTEVQMSGSAAFERGCIHIVSGAVTFTGDFVVDQDCDDPNMREISNISVTLVE